MDDHSVFGPVAHRLSFGQAIEAKLLSNYQVLILGVEDQDVSAAVQQRALVALGAAGVQTDAGTLATAVAVSRVMCEHGARRVISFHSRVKGARRFAQLLTALADQFPGEIGFPGLRAELVSGDMATGARTARLKQLASVGQPFAPSAMVLTNARCLGEGVDVPALDAVVFVDPRRSRVDVVQAVGRAIRLSADKEQGLIVIPVALGAAADLDTALASSAFAPVLEVLAALCDHDDTLALELDTLRTALGRRGALPTGALSRIIIDMPARWDGADFADAIRLRVVETLSSSFAFGLGVLSGYAERTGNALIPARNSEGGFPLGNWVARRRREYAKGTLSPERTDALEQVKGWAWDAEQERFARGLAALEAFVARTGTALVPNSHSVDGFPLGDWVSNRRKEPAAGTLSAGRTTALEQVEGWVWAAAQGRYDRGLAALAAFVVRTGTALVPYAHSEDGFPLGTWVANRRKEHAAGTLRAERTTALEQVKGWVWHAEQERFARGLAALVAFVGRAGTARVPQRHSEDGFPLGTWVSRRRGEYARGTLSAERIAAMGQVKGWAWSAKPPSRVAGSDAGCLR